eukprot:1715343-Prymnesium_polylepis.1
MRTAAPSGRVDDRPCWRPWIARRSGACECSPIGRERCCPSGTRGRSQQRCCPVGPNEGCGCA